MKGFLLVAKTSGRIEKELQLVVGLFKKAEIELEIVTVTDIMAISDCNFNGKIIVAGEERDCPDFVLCGLTEAYSDYEMQAVLRMFESVGVLCVNSYEAMRKTCDKLLTFEIVHKEVPEIEFPKTMLVTSHSTASEIGKVIGFPLVLKVMHGNGGRGVSLVQTEKELKNLLSMIFAADYNDQIIAQEAILSSKGRDLRLMICNGELLCSFVRCNDGSFTSNVHQGGHIEKFEAPAELIEQSIKLANVLDLKMGSIDYLFGENGKYYLCEANAVPGFAVLLNEQDKSVFERLNRQIAKAIMEHPVPAWKKDN